MKKEFNLSEKIFIIDDFETYGKVVLEKDVKEFIRLLKDFVERNLCDEYDDAEDMIDEINKLAGFENA